jgi:hypothetical protein
MAPPTSQRRCNVPAGTSGKPRALRRRSRGNVEASHLFSGSKLGLTNCTQAAILAHEAGLLEGET